MSLRAGAPLSGTWNTTPQSESPKFTMSKVLSLHHFVFSTKHRQMVLPEEHKKELHKYIWGIVKQRKCYLHRVNGVGNHIHMLIDVHPSVSLAALVKDLKISSHNWLRANPNFPYFDRWSEGYYASSLSLNELPTCKDYIINQEEHHLRKPFDEELKELLISCGLSYHIDDLT